MKPGCTQFDWAKTGSPWYRSKHWFRHWECRGYYPQDILRIVLSRFLRFHSPFATSTCTSWSMHRKRPRGSAQVRLVAADSQKVIKGERSLQTSFTSFWSSGRNAVRPRPLGQTTTRPCLLRRFQIESFSAFPAESSDAVIYSVNSRHPFSTLFKPVLSIQMVRLASRFQPVSLDRLNWNLFCFSLKCNSLSS